MAAAAGTGRSTLNNYRQNLVYGSALTAVLCGFAVSLNQCTVLLALGVWDASDNLGTPGMVLR